MQAPNVLGLSHVKLTTELVFKTIALMVIVPTVMGHSARGRCDVYRVGHWHRLHITSDLSRISISYGQCESALVCAGLTSTTWPAWKAPSVSSPQSQDGAFRSIRVLDSAQSSDL